MSSSGCLFCCGVGPEEPKRSRNQHTTPTTQIPTKPKVFVSFPKHRERRNASDLSAHPKLPAAPYALDRVPIGKTAGLSEVSRIHRRPRATSRFDNAGRMRVSLRKLISFDVQGPHGSSEIALQLKVNRKRIGSWGAACLYFHRFCPAVAGVKIHLVIGCKLVLGKPQRNLFDPSRGTQHELELFSLWFAIAFVKSRDTWAGWVDIKLSCINLEGTAVECRGVENGDDNRRAHCFSSCVRVVSLESLIYQQSLRTWTLRTWL